MARQRVNESALARKMGWAQSSINRRLSGKITITTDDLDKIAQALSVPPSQFGATFESRAGRP